MAQTGQPLDYVLLHGLGDTPSRFTTNTSTWNPGGQPWALQEWLSYQSRTAPLVSLGTVTSPYEYNSITRSIPAQATDLPNKVPGLGSRPYMMIGHSQGGLRARYFAEFLAQNQTKTNLKALLTVGSPNQGAPIVVNGPGVIQRINTDATIASLGLLNVASMVITGKASVQEYIPALFGANTTGTMDMAPHSTFMQQLNDYNRVDRCEWVLQWVTETEVGDGGKVVSIRYQEQVYVCTKVNVDKSNILIPPGVITGNMIGTDSNLERAFPGSTATRNTVNTTATALAVAYAIASWWTFGVTLIPAKSAADIAWVARNTDKVLSDAVGSTSHDIVVPTDSQDQRTLQKGGLRGNTHLTWTTASSHVTTAAPRSIQVETGESFLFNQDEAHSATMRRAAIDVQLELTRGGF
nr:hypothetical protein [Deinococcus aestuarii]